MTSTTIFSCSTNYSLPSLQLIQPQFSPFPHWHSRSPQCMYPVHQHILYLVSPKKYGLAINSILRMVYNILRHDKYHFQVACEVSTSYVWRSSRMSRKSMATCFWFQKFFYFLSIYVNDNVKTRHMSQGLDWWFINLTIMSHKPWICMGLQVSGFKFLLTYVWSMKIIWNQ